MFALQKLKNSDPIILVLTIIIALIGLAVVFSSTYVTSDGPSDLFYNHIFYNIVGFGFMLLLSTFNYRQFNRLTSVVGIMFFTFLSLFFVLLFGVEIYGAKRWIEIGSFTVQPSEFAKLSLIITTAYIWSLGKTNSAFLRRDSHGENRVWDAIQKSINFFATDYFKKFFISSLVCLSIVIGVMLQKSLGNSLLLVALFGLVVFSATKITMLTIVYIVSAILTLLISFEMQFKIFKADKSDPILITIIIVCVFMLIFAVLKYRLNLLALFTMLIFALLLPFVISFAYNNLLHDYQRSRIESFINPSEENKLTTDWNRYQSQVAIASGKVLGKGFLKGTQINYGFVPFAYTDFAFAGFAEQFGLVGGFILIALYSGLVYKLLAVGRESEDKFARLVSIGVAGIVVFNLFQHVLMNIGYLPITGVPLPLISYGGSSLITIYCGIGIVLSIQNSIGKKKKRITIL